jgi:hypothetical protein
MYAEHFDSQTFALVKTVKRHRFEEQKNTDKDKEKGYPETTEIKA